MAHHWHRCCFPLCLWVALFNTSEWSTSIGYRTANFTRDPCNSKWTVIDMNSCVLWGIKVCKCCVLWECSFDTFKCIFLFFCQMLFSLAWWVHEVVLWWSQSCQWTLHYTVPCRKINASQTHFVIWELHAVPAFCGKTETEKFNFVFVELTFLLVSCRSWGMKSVEYGVKSSVMFGVDWA